MREIKFRVWDKIHKKVHVVGEKDHDSLTCFDGEIRYYNLQNGEGSSEHGDYTLMQYTGLKDKNGNEIYEGDIVEERYINPLKNEEVSERYKIEHQENSLIKMIHVSNEERWNRLLFMRYNNVEVIGNIYENPELLNA